MANEKTEDVVVKIEGEGDQQLSLLIDDPNDKPAPKPKAKADDDGAAELKKQLASAKQREHELSVAREQEAAARAKAETEAAEAKKQVATTQADAINAALTSTKGEADALQAQIQQAMETGEYKQASELQRKLARAEATIMRYEDAKAELEAQAKKQQPEPKKSEQQPQPQDPLQQTLARLTPRAQAWVREHPEFATDPKMNRKLVAAHHAAVADDYVYESDAYFARLEEILGIGGDGEGDTEVAEETPRKQPRHSAPVTREAPANKHGVSGNRVTLSKAEVEMAKDLGMTPTEYATFKRKAVASGSYDPR